MKLGMMMVAFLFYGYATEVFSSRWVEREMYDSVAGRYVAANRKWRGLRLGLVLGILLSPQLVRAELGESLFRAVNGQLYQILQHNNLDNGGFENLEDVLVTTIAARVSSPGLSICAASGSKGVNPTEALAFTPNGTMIDASKIFKSGVINDASFPCFNPVTNGGNGQICIGPGCDGSCGCSVATCAAFTINGAAGLGTATTGIPAGSVTNITATAPTCATATGGVPVSTIGFGTLPPSIAVDVCGADPVSTNGFLLPSTSGFTGGTPGSSAIFAYNTLPSDALAVAVGLFHIDRNGVNNSGCPAVNPDDVVVAASGRTDSQGPPPPTKTPTPTPTSTRTPTPTPTPTITRSPPPTNTPAPTNTSAPTNTVTPTPTITPTPLPTLLPNDCCQCIDTVTCAQPVGGRCTLVCGNGSIAAGISGAVCLPAGVPGAGGCATRTPTASPTPSPIPGPNDCCQCSGLSTFCAVPVDGRCAVPCAGGTPPVPVYGAVCVLPGNPGAGICSTVTPTPTRTATPTPTPTNFPSCVTHPEDLIPGGESKNECVEELCAIATTSLTKRRLPSRIVPCKDDDPTCDFGKSTGDMACTFFISLCYNVTERRFACNLTGAITRVHLAVPNEDQPKDATQLAARDAIEGALMKLGGAVGTDNAGHRSVIFDPPLTQRDACTDFIPIQVPLRLRLSSSFPPLRGKLKFRFDVFQGNSPLTGKAGLPNRDGLTLICKP